MINYLDLNREKYLNKKFNMLLVVDVLKHGRNRKVICCVCICDCGKTTHPIRMAWVANGRTKSCGCLRILAGIKAATKHGLRQSKTYASWINLTLRARKNRVDFYDPWFVFENFLKDMGEKPVGYELMIIDKSIMIGPGNCIWDKTTKDREGELLTVLGETKTIKEWSEEAFTKVAVIISNLRKGMTPEEAIFKVKSKKSNA